MSKDEFIEYILHTDLEELMKTGQKIRQEYRGNQIEFCSIISVKTAKCSEDCHFCAQSALRKKPIEYQLLEEKEIQETIKNYDGKINRLSLVSSGRSLKKEFKQVLSYYENLSGNTDIKLCASHGLLSQDQFKELSKAGVKRYHCNLESSENFFSKICSSHSYQDKVENIKRAQKEGLEICSGGIIGMGEDFGDRYDLAMALKELNVDSIPINILLPQEGSPLENQKFLSKEEILRSLLLFRHLLPRTSIRIAAGRGHYENFEEDLLKTGIDALMTGYLLTTTGSNTDQDLKTIKELGYERMYYES